MRVGASEGSRLNRQPNRTGGVASCWNGKYDNSTTYNVRATVRPLCRRYNAPPCLPKNDAQADGRRLPSAHPSHPRRETTLHNSQCLATIFWVLSNVVVHCYSPVTKLLLIIGKYKTNLVSLNRKVPRHLDCGVQMF